MSKQEEDGLMHQIASKFTLLESRIQSQNALNDRVAKLEAKLSSHSDLHHRVNSLESKYPSSHDTLSKRVSHLETQLQPDPEHECLITRINAKLDLIEKAQHTKLSSNASYSAPANTSASANKSLTADAEMRYLQDRIDRLTTLRARYAKEERELLD